MTTIFSSSSQRQLINELQIIIPKSIIHLIPILLHSIPYTIQRKHQRGKKKKDGKKFIKTPNKIPLLY